MSNRTTSNKLCYIIKFGTLNDVKKCCIDRDALHYSVHRAFKTACVAKQYETVKYLASLYTLYNSNTIENAIIDEDNMLIYACETNQCDLLKILLTFIKPEYLMIRNMIDAACCRSNIDVLEYLKTKVSSICTEYNLQNASKDEFVDLTIYLLNHMSDDSYSRHIHSNLHDDDKICNFLTVSNIDYTALPLSLSKKIRKSKIKNMDLDISRLPMDLNHLILKYY